MGGKKKILISVSQTGEVSYKLEGFAGKGCSNIADLISKVGKEKSREKTPEYYLAGGAPEGVLVKN